MGHVVLFLTIFVKIVAWFFCLKIITLSSYKIIHIHYRKYKEAKKFKKRKSTVFLPSRDNYCCHILVYVHLVFFLWYNFTCFFLLTICYKYSYIKYSCRTLFLIVAHKILLCDCILLLEFTLIPIIHNYEYYCNSLKSFEHKYLCKFLIDPKLNKNLMQTKKWSLKDFLNQQECSTKA